VWLPSPSWGLLFPRGTCGPWAPPCFLETGTGGWVPGRGAMALAVLTGDREALCGEPSSGRKGAAARRPPVALWASSGDSLGRGRGGVGGTVSLEGAAPSGAALVGRCPVLWANAVAGLAPVAGKGSCLWETKGNGQVWLPWGVVLFRAAIRMVRDPYGLRTSDGGKGRKGWPCRGALCVLAVG